MDSLLTKVPALVQAYSASPSHETLSPLLTNLRTVISLPSVADRRRLNGMLVKALLTNLDGVRGGTGDDLPNGLRVAINTALGEISQGDFKHGGEDNKLRRGL